MSLDPYAVSRARAKRARRWAIAGSFVVYLLPIVTVHWTQLLGSVLVLQLTACGDACNAAWTAATVAGALALQAAAAAVIAWALGGGLRRAVVALATIPLFLLAAPFTFLYAIPLAILVAPDRAPEKLEWPEHCRVDGSLHPVRMPVGLPGQSLRAWWIVRTDGDYALLDLASCAVHRGTIASARRTPPGKTVSQDLVFAVAGGAAIVARSETPSASSEPSYWLLPRPDGQFEELPPPGPNTEPNEHQGPPILSSQGDAVAWLEYIPDSGPPVLSRVIVVPAGGSTVVRQTIDLGRFGPGMYMILELDTKTERVTLWREDRLLVVGFDGSEQDAIGPFAEVAVRGTLQRTPDGWLAWDAYRERDPYRLTWSLARGARTHTLPKGRNITSAALDPTHRFVAVSTSSASSISNSPDAVIVLDAADGREVYRRHLTQYSRSPVVFAEGGFFAYSADGQIHVVRLPIAEPREP